MSTVGGLPAHVLLVHAVVVLVPLSALLLVLVAAWPAARDRLVWPTALLAVLALVSVPLATDAGEWLERRVPSSPLVRLHTELGDTLLPWTIGVAAVAVAVLARHLASRWTGRDASTVDAPARRRPVGGPAVTAVAAVLAVVVAVGSVLTVYRIGESGARAAWTGQFSTTPISGGGPDVPSGRPSAAPR